MEKDKAQFLPFHAINDFMMPDYRLSVLHSVLANLDKLGQERRSAIQGLLRRSLNIAGFRNPLQAPVALKARNLVSPFENNHDLVAQIVSAWVELRPELRQQVFDLLTELEWELLPVDADRTKLPGFLTRWPKSDSFDAITGAFHEKYPDTSVADNDISLMVVWLGGRLPYDVVEKDPGEAREL